MHLIQKRFNMNSESETKNISLESSICKIRSDYKQVLKAAGATNIEAIEEDIPSIVDSHRYPFHKIYSLMIVEEWKERQLDLNDSGRCTIMKEILFVNLDAVQTLCLKDNRFVSLESFSRLKMPKIDTIWFNSNELISVRDLRKGNWPTLRVLGIHQNTVLDSQKLAELDCVFDRIVVDVSVSPAYQSQKIAWVAKTKGELLRDIYCQASGFRKIEQKKAAMALHKKNVGKLCFHPDSVI